MIITGKHLPRRSFLQGMGATVALPMLDAMVPALTATRLECDGSQRGQRFRAQRPDPRGLAGRGTGRPNHPTRSQRAGWARDCA